MRSDRLTKGAAAAPQRAILKALGLSDAEIERPLIGIVNSQNDIVPGHVNLDKITEAVKEEYLAGSDRDREKLEKKLLALEDADGNPLYEEKDFTQWVNQADKKAEKAKDERNWWEGGEVKMT